MKKYKKDENLFKLLSYECGDCSSVSRQSLAQVIALDASHNLSPEHEL